MRFKCGEKIIEMSDEEIENIIEMHKMEKRKKEENEKTLSEVTIAVSTLEEQLNVLKENVKGLQEKIKDSDANINKEIIVG